MRYLILLCLAWLLAAPLRAAEPQPAFLQPEVLKAALAIELTDEQKPQFQAALTTFVNERIEAMNLLLRRNNQTDLPRKIKSKTNRLLKQMDKDMAEFLSEEQMPAYKNYRNTLKANLQGM